MRFPEGQPRNIFTSAKRLLPIPVAMTALALTTGCAKQVELSSDLINCKDPARQSGETTVFLKPNSKDKVSVRGQEIKSNFPGKIGPSGADWIQFGFKGEVYSVSGEPLELNGVTGTQVTIQAKCETPQTNP